MTKEQSQQQKTLNKIKKIDLLMRETKRKPLAKQNPESLCPGVVPPFGIISPNID